MSKATYPISVIAKLLDLSDRRVQQLTREGVIPKAERGRYELVPAVQGYIRYLRDRSIGKDGAVIPDIAAERARLIKEQADKFAMENATARGELLPALLVGRAWEKAITSFRARMLVLPRKALPRLRGASGDAAKEKILSGMVREALNELVASDCSGIVSGACEGLVRGGEDFEAPAGPDDQPMGRREPDLEPGVQCGAGEVEHSAS